MQDGNLRGREEGGIDGVGRHLRGGRVVVLLHGREAQGLSGILEREGRRTAARGDSRNRGDARDHLVPRLPGTLALERDRESDQSLRLEAQSLVAQIDERAEEQARADAEDEGERQLRRREHGAEPCASTREGRERRAEVGEQVGAAAADRGDEPDEDADRQGEQCAGEDDARVHRDLTHPRE